MDSLERALLVAEKIHANQSYDIYPYMYHIKQVVMIARKLGYDNDIVTAAALHDALEDSELSYTDIKKAFGEEVAEIVYCVTDELGRNRKEKKEKTYPKIRNNWKAAVVKICDRIANTKHSKLYNHESYQRYCEEFDNFYAQIHSDQHPQKEMKKAWDVLNKVMEIQFQTI